MEWHNMTTVKKGDIGEKIVSDWLISHGYIPYTPQAAGAHPFDKLCASRDKKTIFVAEVKSKPARTYYPDTGIDVRHYDDYKYIQSKYNIDVFLFFVDEDKRQIYGGKLSRLETQTEIIHNGKKISYPLEHRGIIYFPLSAMQIIGELTDNQAASLNQHSTRNEAYKRQP